MANKVMQDVVAKRREEYPEYDFYRTIKYTQPTLFPRQLRVKRKRNVFSYSLNVAEDLAIIQLLFAPADRVGFRLSFASRPRLVACCYALPAVHCAANVSRRAHQT